jgi:RNA polymerase sigma factor (sigma-70 family)
MIENEPAIPHLRFAALARHHLKPLFNFVRREIAYREAIGDLAYGEVGVGDVVDEVLARAAEQAARNAAKRNVRASLIKLALEQIKAAVRRSRSERSRRVSTDTDVPETPPMQQVSTLGDEILDFYEPDEDWKAADVIRDRDVPTPEQVLESRELQQYVGRILAQLPRAWRLAFTLRYLESLPLSQIAHITARPTSDVRTDLKHARAFLRERLLEAGFTSASDNNSAALFATRIDTEIPNSYHNAVVRRTTDRQTPERP